MDKEIIAKLSEAKELNKVLYMDHDQTKAMERSNWRKLDAVENALLKADEKFDRKRERG